MTFKPWRRQEPLDHTELARLLPAPGDPVLSDDRHRLLEDYLMSNLIENSRRLGMRRHLLVRLAAPLALAAAAALAGTAFAVNHTTAHSDSPTATTAGFPQRVSTVAYTLNRDTHGAVTVTIREAGGAGTDLAQLQHDLERMGVDARVYQDDPSCPPDTDPGPDLDSTEMMAIVTGSERPDGAYTATIHTSKIPTGTHLEIVFPPLIEGSTYRLTWAYGVRSGNAPQCRHWFMPSAPGPTPTRKGETTPDHHHS
jgi:hypothetical protein